VHLRPDNRRIASIHPFLSERCEEVMPNYFLMVERCLTQVSSEIRVWQWPIFLVLIFVVCRLQVVLVLFQYDELYDVSHPADVRLVE